MRCLAVCQDELVIRMLDEILLPGFEVEFIVENRPLARRLHEAGVTVTTGDPKRTDTWLKADIVRRGHELGVPFALTWSCYRGGEKQCGRCTTCDDRRKAFHSAGVADPTEYEG